MTRTWVLALALLSVSAPLAAEVTWSEDLYDPAARAEMPAPADLILPMPCGGAMAFQKVSVPVDTADPLDDRRIRVGQSQAESGYADYLRSEYIRGAFTDAEDSYYFVARYELTVGQYAALNGECVEPSRADRLAKGGLSWFEAVGLSQTYSEWLLANARDALPATGGAPAYLRLPTEAEWEYAVRGGARIDPAQFPARRFFGDGELAEYAIFLAPGAGRGELGPVGIRQPNPLGLYDVYGNAEELQLEPFRLNAVGREHGQTGGLVTRGGSALSIAEQIYSAQRTEYPMFSADSGRALAGGTFGLRLVLTASITGSDSSLTAIRDRWVAMADAPTDAGDDPLAALAALVGEEVDPRRQTALMDLQLEFRTSQAQTEAALQEAAKSTFLSGAVFVGALSQGADEIARQGDNIRNLIDQVRVSQGEQQANLMRVAEGMGVEIERLRQVQRTYLLSFRSALETLIREFPEERRQAAHQLLADELALAGQDEISHMLLRFWADLQNYAVTPDMSDGDLLTLALAL